MQNTENSFILKGDIVYSISPDTMITVKNGYAVCIDGISKGVFVTLPEIYKNLKIYDYSNKLIIPGLVDLHIHAPQYAFRGTEMDLELMDWLKQHTFPEEAKYADLSYAKKAYGIFAASLRKSATSHACIFATSHRQATELLMEFMEKSGIESYVGKVNMDRNAPENICEYDAEYAFKDTFNWIDNVSNRFSHTKPILTPRFIPCCSPDLLNKLQEIQTIRNLPVQSHLSENLNEIEYVKQLEPDCGFYGNAYDKYSLFGKNYHNNTFIPTIMAHCVYSVPEEIQLMKENGVFVAHCPASNINLSSGIAPIRKYMNLGLNIGLGSDVAGGHSESILRAVCDAIQSSKLYCRLINSDDRPLNFKEAFYLATKGGGAFFGKVGSFEDSYEFNADILNDSLIPHPTELSITERLECATYESLDLYGICAKYVSGRLLFDF